MRSILLTFLLLAVPYQIILRDGSKIEARGPAKQSGSVSLIRLPSGTLTSVPSEEIDTAATLRANSLRPTPTPASSGPAVVRQVKTIDLNGPEFSPAPPVTGNSSAPSSLSPSSSSASGPVQVRGYTNSHGTYVAPYTRSAPSSGGGHGKH